jgi:predicted acylesterase/phospholipase RssA
MESQALADRVTYRDYYETIKLGIAGFVTAFVVVALFNVDQAIECLIVMAQNLDKSGRFIRLVWLGVAMSLFAWMLWYWTRALQYAFLRKVDSRPLSGIRFLIPIAVGLIPVLGLSRAFLRAGNLSQPDITNTRRDLYGLASVLLVLAICLAAGWAWRGGRLQFRNDPRQRLPRNFWIPLGISGAVAVIFAVVFTTDSQFAQHFGAITIIITAASAWVIVVHLLIFFGTWLRIRVFLILLAWIALWSALDTNDDHQLRHSTVTGKVSHEGLERAFTDWLNHRADMKAYGAAPYPVVLVAAEGGGIYAAYHAALILADLQDQQQAFAQHIFVISGVSGGSVGASVFAALMAPKEQVSSLGPGPAGAPFTGGAVRYFYPDFLSPVIAKTVYSDTFQQLWPCRLPDADRAKALEQSLEQAWNLASEKQGNNPWPEDFDAMWKNFATGATPALMLNTTEVETGRQIAVSNLGAGQYGPHMFFDSHPSVHLPLSTATALSARFPIITPAGLEALPDGTERRYVDGGYSENSGLGTVTTVATDLLALTGSKNVHPFRLIVLRIGMYLPPALFGPAEEAATAGVSGDKNTDASFGEAGSPIRTMLNTRTAHEETVVGSFHAIFDHQPMGKYFELFLTEDRMKMPLGWLLSDRVKDEIERQVKTGPQRELILQQLEP